MPLHDEGTIEGQGSVERWAGVAVAINHKQAMQQRMIRAARRDDGRPKEEDRIGDDNEEKKAEGGRYEFLIISYENKSQGHEDKKGKVDGDKPRLERYQVVERCCRNDTSGARRMQRGKVEHGAEDTDDREELYFLKGRDGIRAGTDFRHFCVRGH